MLKWRSMLKSSSTIVAISTPPGTGGIAVIRLSGASAIEIVDAVFKGKKLSEQPSHTVHYGVIHDENGQALDDVVATIFRAPHSYTTENTVEISCHGSLFIQGRLLELFVKNGAQLAKPGEFTMRAFLNGRMDLAQAEAVADLIAAESESAHRVAIDQMRGGVSRDIQKLRDELVHFASMIELELDFGEEDVEFADRDDLKKLVENIRLSISKLLDSFRMGNALKNGIPIAIAGKPNTGKSTLLNALLNEEKAIVSPIAGTTRDIIEDTIQIEGILFRFIDTAGLRETADVIEKIGVERAREKIKEAALLLYVFDCANVFDVHGFIEEHNLANAFGIPFLMIGNKADITSENILEQLGQMPDTWLLAAKEKHGLDKLKKALVDWVKKDGFKPTDVLLSNARHAEALYHADGALSRVLDGLSNGVSGDFLAMDIRHALRYLGEILGVVDVEELLESIFGKFCIGK